VLAKIANRLFLLWLAGTFLFASGCLTKHGCTDPAKMAMPRELGLVALPPYEIQPPDVLVIDAVTVVPKPPYRISALDYLYIQLAPDNLPKDFPPDLLIAGLFPVGPDGTVNLGARLQTVEVTGKTLEEATKAIEDRIKKLVKKEFRTGIRVSVELARSRAMLQIRGEHLVRPDGTVGLGSYGSVPVAGLTIDEARKVIETYLAQYLLKPEISLDVAGYNSKVYYVVTDGGGSGEQVARLPITGHETVLDAISGIYGLPAVASKKQIWIARPLPAETNETQILPVDWKAIVMNGKTATNYQIFPGDRVYVNSQTLVKTDNILAKVISPIERILGVTLLGNTTEHAFERFSRGGGSGTGVP
jgi:polysaccharide export outer membrane protein